MAISGFVPYQPPDLRGWQMLGGALQDWRTRRESERAMKEMEALRSQVYEPQQALTDIDLPALAENAKIRKAEFKDESAQKALDELKALSGQNMPIDEAWSAAENVRNKYSWLPLRNPFDEAMKLEELGMRTSGKGKSTAMMPRTTYGLDPASGNMTYSVSGVDQPEVVRLGEEMRKINELSGDTRKKAFTQLMVFSNLPYEDQKKLLLDGTLKRFALANQQKIVNEESAINKITSRVGVRLGKDELKFAPMSYPDWFNEVGKQGLVLEEQLLREKIVGMKQRGWTSKKIFPLIYNKRLMTSEGTVENISKEKAKWYSEQIKIATPKDVKEYIEKFPDAEEARIKMLEDNYYFPE